MSPELHSNKYGRDKRPGRNNVFHMFAFSPGFNHTVICAMFDSGFLEDSNIEGKLSSELRDATQAARDGIDNLTFVSWWSCPAKSVAKEFATVVEVRRHYKPNKPPVCILEICWAADSEMTRSCVFYVLRYRFSCQHLCFLRPMIYIYVKSSHSKHSV